VKTVRSFWIALLVLAIAGSAGVVARGAALADGTATADPSAPPADDPVALRELAERVLSPIHAPPGGVHPTARLVVGAVATEAGVDLPVPPGGRIVGSVVRSSDPKMGGSSVDVVADAPGTPAEAVSYYEKALEAQGFTLPPGMIAQVPHGFVAVQPTIYLTLCRPAGGWLSINVAALTPQTADVRLNVQSGSNGVGPCGPNAKGAPMAGKFPPGYELLPALYAPTGVALVQIGAPGGFDRFGSEATTTSAQTAAALEDAFAAQLAKAGWKRTGGAHDAGLAWSAWSVDGGAWSGLLFVSERPGGRDLSVRIVKR
jgi:hypothetical protein